jgi:GNAT superfamily N-acetyltransferase
VLYEAFVAYEPCYTREAFAATAPPSSLVRDRMGEGPVWVAPCGEAIVGTVSAVPKDEDVYVRGMAVLPRARGKGIGGSLLSQVEEYASARGHRRLVLSTTPFLTDAIELYERSGFRRSDEGPHDLLGTPLFTMVKVLEPSGPGREAARAL